MDQLTIEEAARIAAQKAREAVAAGTLHWDDPVEILNPDRIFQARDLQVWKHPLRRIAQGLYPNCTCFPNPLLHEDLVVASTFSPGRICAVSKSSGERRWLHRLPSYGTLLVSAQGYLLAGTSHSLLSLSPETGKTRWAFTPYPNRKEVIYSQPLCTEGSVFVGDRCGVFHCLSAESGKTLWSVLTAPSGNRSVNAAALAFEDLVITATNAKLVLAYDQASGREVWRKTLPDCSIYQIQWYEGMALVRTTQVLYGLCPRTGDTLQQWGWRGKEIVSIAAAGSYLCLAVTNEPRMRDGKRPARPRTELLGMHRDRIKWRLSYPRYSGIALRWDSETGLLYEAMYYGLGVVDPATGRRVALVQGFSRDIYEDHVGLPCVDAGKVYILDRKGTLWALRHPVIAA